MKLEKIEINGFKSFADKTEILLDGAITGIVGPNGSGKSNIADAVRWVLGEQNSRSLRGTKMEDVIFGGTQNRRPKAYCEVSLYFDNGDRRIPAEYSEIVITRKMFRSGESEYLLNRTPVRLKDILDIVRDTGIGREGYSIVGQGKIDEILSAKPGARRKVFEEAAGVMKFRARKEEAENKLQKTQDNLVRIGDILEELNAQIGPLSEQAEKTKKYLSLFERQKFLDANLFLVNYERVQTRLKKLKSDLTELEREIRLDRARFGDAVQVSEQLAERLKTVEQSLSSLREQYEEATAAAEQAGAEKNIAAERIAGADKDIDRLNAERQAAEAQERQLQAQQVQLKDMLGQQLAQEAKLSQEILSCEALCLEAERLEAERRAKLQKVQAEHFTLLEKQNELQRSLATVDAREEGAAASIAEWNRRVQKTQSKLQQNQALSAELETELKELQKQTDDLRKQIQQNRQEAMELRRRQKEAEQGIAAANGRYREALSRGQFLEKLKQEYEGYTQGVKNLMRETHRQPMQLRGILGTLAELIEIPQVYEKAMEAALGGALQNVVVQTDADAKAAIELLRAKKLGRVSFMPLQSLKVRSLSAKEEGLLVQDMQRADRVVQCKDDVRTAVAFLLARTVIVKDMDAAIALARRAGHSFRVVTLEGDLINPGGVMTGGSMQQRNFGLISREREIEQSQVLAKENLAQLQQLQAQSKALSGQMEQMQQKHEKLSAELKELEIAQADRQAQLQNAVRQAEALKLEKAQDTLQLSEIQKASGQSAEHAALLQEQLQVLQQKIDQTVAQQGQLQQPQQEDKRQELAELQVQQARLQGDIQRSRETEAGLVKQMQMLAEEQQRKRAEADNLTKQKELLQAGLAQYGQTQQQHRRQAETLRSQIEQEESQRLLANEKLTELQKQGTEYQLRQAELSENKYKLESQMERLSLSMENAQNKLWDDYGMTYGEAETLKETINYTQGARELQEIREQIRALGAVNPNAIEDYNRVYERANEMTAQKQDLEKAKADLETLIQNILASMRVVFSEKFEQINRNFKEIFHELFGGGSASISLMEGDIMECGIEITAEPPGKKLQHISLLSGGERALTGIALLFAMIRINPAPLCLLDEIDAPLDEANLVRFGNYITKIPDSQFVIITHRKPTMAICQVLFGVTMEEKGVSKLVSVKIEEQE